MLRPEFSDRRLCSRCHAPAQLIGAEFTAYDGTTAFRATPIRHKTGVFTHVCTRMGYSMPDGSATTDDFYAYECGALRDTQTRQVQEHQMPERCHVEPS
jgi:hypothetical protein